MWARRQFEARVVLPFDISAGRTPSPHHLQYRREVRAASCAWRGRLARSVCHRPLRRIRRNHPKPAAGNYCVPPTTSKDQSYFLWGLSQEPLSAQRLPSRRTHQGGVRALPAVRIYQFAEKPESKELCLCRRETTCIYPAYYESRGFLANAEGEIVSENGRELAAINGIHIFDRPAQGPRLRRRHPLYVLSIDPEKTNIASWSAKTMSSERRHRGRMREIGFPAKTLRPFALRQIRHKHERSRLSTICLSTPPRRRFTFERAARSITQAKLPLVYKARRPRRGWPPLRGGAPWASRFRL